MPGNGAKLTRTQEAAIAALLTESTVAAAAAKVKVRSRTLRNWLGQPAFRQAYQQARQEVLSQTVSRLLALTDKAVTTLEEELTAANKSADRTRAAVAILDRAVKGVAVLDFEERLRVIEERMQKSELL